MFPIRRVGKFIKTIACHHNAHQRFYSQIIDHDRLYYGCRDEIEASVAGRRMPISLELTIIPCLFQIVMITRGVFSILWSKSFQLEDRTKYGSEIFAGGGRIEIEYCFLLWSILYLLSAFYEMSRIELDFGYLSVWSHARESECVGPWQMNEVDCDRLRLYRNRMTTLEVIICLTDLPITFISLFLSSVLTQEKSVYLIYPLSAWFWLTYTVVWAAYAVRTAYCTPSRFSVVGYCLQLKQRHLLKRLISLHQRPRLCKIPFRLFTLYRDDRRLANELAAYNRFWTGQLSILLEVYCVVISYVAYIIIWTVIPASYYILFCVIFAAHLLCLASLAGICVRLVRLDREIGNELNRLHQRSLTRRRLGLYSRIRFHDLASGRRWDTKRGFLIWNKQIIDSSYCLKILFSMVALFLLTVKSRVS